jgi:hypothetical protein
VTKIGIFKAFLAVIILGIFKAVLVVTMLSIFFLGQGSATMLGTFGAFVRAW